MRILQGDTYVPRRPGAAPVKKKRHMTEEGLAAISNAQKKRWAKSREASSSPTTATSGIKTSDIRMRAGEYHCPECGRGYPLRRSLGKHRSARHGINGISKSAVALRKQLKRNKKLANHNGEIIEPPANNQGEDNGSITLTAHRITTQRIASNRSAAPPEWNDENRAGYLFAHVQSQLENAAQGGTGSKQNITQRLSELLHLEVRGTEERERSLRLLRGMS